MKMKCTKCGTVFLQLGNAYKDGDGVFRCPETTGPSNTECYGVVEYLDEDYTDQEIQTLERGLNQS